MDNYEFKSKKIELEESSNPKVSIDGESVQVSHDSDANEFNTAELAYQSFGSVKDLAEAIVEQRLQNE